MTAVVSPPSLPSLSHLGWKSSSKIQAGGFDSSRSAGEVQGQVATRNEAQRTNPSSSASNEVKRDHLITHDTSIELHAKRGGHISTKSGRTLWGAPKAEAEKAHIDEEPPYSQAGAPISATNSGGQGGQGVVIAHSQKQMQQAPQLNGGRVAMAGQQNADPPALLVLLPMNGTFERKQITVPYFPDILRIGRQTNAKTIPTPVNGYFDSKVLSRQHAEVWADRSGKIWIRDVKSSNGTFVNGVRLSPESRDSEPHELRENDILELGIDIVSEDQKSIVHHKVSAKIEHAGIQANSSSVLDLNLGDIDPGSGGGLMGGLLPSQAHRGRTGSQSSVMSNGRMTAQNMNGNMNSMGVQRHMNAWLSPVSIEQVVKRLGNELKQARQQAQDLQRTSEFFNAVLSSQPGQELPKPPASILPPPPPPPKTNGVTSPKKVDPVSPFSQPPAPPPQQPLPEKPDVPQQSSYKRGEDEFGASPKQNNISPIKSDASSSQILTMAEALAAARKEIDLQGSKVRHLEELLKQERKARESAEQRTRILLEQTKASRGDHEVIKDEDNAYTSNAGVPLQVEDTDNSDAVSIESFTSDTTVVTDKALEAAHISPERSSTSALQEQLTLVLVEMDEMKAQMENYRRRAESAEEERSTLADMVRRIRTESAEASEAAAKRNAGPKRAGSTERSEHATSHESVANGTAHLADKLPTDFSHALEKSVTATQQPSKHEHDNATNATRQKLMLHSAMATMFDQRGSGDARVEQVAPYASILGVVLLGVGIMAYLNSWQKAER